jgi:hypothetical protein
MIHCDADSTVRMPEYGSRGNQDILRHDDAR